MSRRIEIELTSARPDGTWTWRAAGAREPKGVLDGTVLPGGSKVGDVLRAEAEADLDGMTITSVTPPKGKHERTGLLEILPSDKPFEAVTQQLAKRDRDDRRPRRDRDDRRPRRDGDGGDRRPRREGETGGERRERRPRQEGEGGERRERRPRPSFTPPPELPQRPKAKRLKPGRAHRNAVLAELPEEQRPIAEMASQGIPAVRQRLREDNAKAKAEGKPEMPEAGVLKMAEELLPKLRVAEWLDRADAAKRDVDELDLRDLRSVVAASDDPVVARDESTRALAEELKQALVTKQEREYTQWLEDIDAALGVGRVIRALKMSGQPPKAGALFPADLATRLAQATSESLTADATPDRWAAVLEAMAFSPVRAQVVPAAVPTQSSDELVATVTRLASLVPQVATLFGITPAAGKPAPKPLRPTRPARNEPARKPKPIPPPPTKADTPAEATAPAPAPAADAQPPAADTTATPDADTTATPDADTTAAPDADTTATPDADTTATPDADTTATPDADTTATPDADATATPVTDD